MTAMVMTHTYAKGQHQRSLGSKVRVETDERTDRGDCTTSHANIVSNKLHPYSRGHNTNVLCGPRSTVTTEAK